MRAGRLNTKNAGFRPGQCLDVAEIGAAVSAAEAAGFVHGALKALVMKREVLEEEAEIKAAAVGLSVALSFQKQRCRIA